MVLIFARLRSLLVQLLALIVFPMVIVLILVAYGGITLHEHAMKSLVSERDARAVRAAAETFADRFAQRRLALQMLAAQVADGASLDQILSTTPELRDVFDGGLIATDGEGTVIASWQPGTQWASGLRDATIPWVFEHDSPSPMLVMNATSAGSTISLFGGLSLFSLDVTGALGIMQDNPQTRVFLIDGDAHIIADSAGEAIGRLARAFPALAAHLTGASEGADHGTGDEDTDMITVSAMVDGLAWTLVAQEPWAEVVSSALRLSLAAPLAVIPAILLATGVLVFGIVRIVVPLQRLGRAAAALAWGDFNALRQPVGGVQEIRELQTALNHMAQRLQQAQAGMHSYIGAMIRGQEDERKRIARELHDDTLQALIALDQRRQMVQRTLERNPQGIGSQLSEMRSMLELTITSLRRVIRDMRPTYIEDLGLGPALEMLCAPHADSAQPRVILTITGMPRRLPADQELGLYRIAQEAVANALRHAAASQVMVGLHYGSEMLLSVSDDGRGFSLPARPGAFAQAGHYGLMGIVERAEQMGAQLRIDSESGRGTTISVSIPVAEPSDGAPLRDAAPRLA